jgi:hypothetical protein
MKNATVAITILAFLVGVGIMFIIGIGQASQSAYQEGLMAGKASAQAAAYDQGYEKGYASALYEVQA